MWCFIIQFGSLDLNPSSWHRLHVFGSGNADRIGTSSGANHSEEAYSKIPCHENTVNCCLIYGLKWTSHVSSIAKILVRNWRTFFMVTLEKINAFSTTVDFVLGFELIWYPLCAQFPKHHDTFFKEGIGYRIKDLWFSVKVQWLFSRMVCHICSSKSLWIKEGQFAKSEAMISVQLIESYVVNCFLATGWNPSPLESLCMRVVERRSPWALHWSK